MNFDKQQQAVLNTKTTSMVIGGYGTGKTTMLVEKAAKLLQDGVNPAEIFVAAFSFRSLKYIRSLLIKRLGKEVAQQLTTGTFRDFAFNEIIRSGEKEPLIAPYVTVKRLMHQAMKESDFNGSTAEAEHVIRTFKARARRPQEKERYYGLLKSYKDYMDNLGLVDRYDIVRKHIVGIGSGDYKSVPAKYILVDNVQDATEIQMYWLIEHINSGIKAIVFGDDDQCVFTLDGALANRAFEMMDDLDEKAEKIMLNHCYRNSKNLGSAAAVLLEQIGDRVHKRIDFPKDKKQTTITIHGFATAKEELADIANNLQSLLKKNAEMRIGVLTRTEFQAQRVSKKLKEEKVKHSCLATNIWDTPGAIVVLDALEVLLNTAKDEHLQNMLLGFGMNLSLVNNLFANGLIAKDWLKKGAKLPKGVDLPNAALQEYGVLQRKLVGYLSVLSSGHSKPREVFKAISHDLIQKMNMEDKNDALLAVETLTLIKGKLTDILPEIRKRKAQIVSAQIIVAPVREVRNQEFDYVLMPYASDGNYPNKFNKALPIDETHERRVMYLAVTRAKKGLLFTHTGKASKYVRELEAALQHIK